MNKKENTTMINKEFFYEMIKTASVSGSEFNLQRKIINYMKDDCDEIISDDVGNVTSIINKNSPIKVMLSGHIDEIGLIITHILDNGMIKVVKAGGIRIGLYIGQHVNIHNQKGVVGGVVVTNEKLQSNKKLKTSDITIDIGTTTKQETLSYIAVGDTITIDYDYQLLKNNRISARAIDDRGGAFIILEALKLAKKKGCSIGVYATTSVGEETNMRGAHWAASRIQPTLGIAVDVTFATDYEGTNPENSGLVEIGKGPVLCHSNVVNPIINKRLIKAAKNATIDYQLESYMGNTGTDADKILFAGQGFPVALVSLPLRYMHSSIELASLDDIDACIELLSEFLCQIEESINLNPYQEE